MTYPPPQWHPGQPQQYQQQAPTAFPQPMQQPPQAPPPYAPQAYQQPPHPPGAAPAPYPHQPRVYSGPMPNPRSQTMKQNRIAFVLGTVFTVGIVGFVVIYNVFVV